MQQITITANGRSVTPTLADNASARAFAELLAQGDLTLSLEDYGGFEKVGPIGQTLPTNDENITTASGDIILYQGNKLVIYYDHNTWSFTKLGHIDGATGESMRDLLGVGDVEATFSLAD